MNVGPSRFCSIAIVTHKNSTPSTYISSNHCLLEAFSSSNTKRGLDDDPCFGNNKPEVWFIVIEKFRYPPFFNIENTLK